MPATDFDILQTLYDNAVEHRKYMLKNLVREMRSAGNELIKKAADIALIAEEGGSDPLPKIDDILATISSAKALYPAIAETRVIIANIEQLTHGKVRRSAQPTLPKGPTNVTQLPRKPQSSTKASGSSTTTRPNQGADNPGRERQRQRKQSQNNQ